VIVPTDGAAGGTGELIMTLFDCAEVQPEASVTVKLYVPKESPDIVVLDPEPEIDPGFIVQVPTDGKPPKTTLPVGKLQVGEVIVPTVGAEGALGPVITTFAEGTDVHPAELVTVKLYVPINKPEIVILLVLPV
jgi:hypothetical protein